MKRLCVSLLIGFFVFAAQALFAEAIFMKDGSIIEGEVISETDQRLRVRVGKDIREIQRAEVLRILFTDDYKQKRYIYTEDDREIAGYIVAEDRNIYTVRRDLNSPEEFTVQKKDVTGVMSRSIRQARPVDTYKSPGLFSISLGLYAKGFFPDELWNIYIPSEEYYDEFDDEWERQGGHYETFRYEPLSIGAVVDLDLNPRHPLFFRIGLLYAAGELIDNIFDELNHKGGFGMEFFCTAGFTIYNTQRFRLWAGPQIGFLFLDNDYKGKDSDWWEEYDEDLEEWISGEDIEIYMELSPRIIYIGVTAGFDYSLTDSLFLTVDMGLRFGYGDVDVKMKEDFIDDAGEKAFSVSEKNNFDLRGSGAYIGLGVMYRL